MSRRITYLQLLGFLALGCDDSRSWGAPETAVSAFGALGRPYVAFGPGGDLIVVFTAEGAPDTYDLWTTRWGGDAWSAPELLEQGAAHVGAVAIGSDAAGKVVVVWDQGLEVRARVLDADGWGPEELVAANATIPDFAMGSLGIGWAVYFKQQNGGEVEARRFDGASWDAPITVDVENSPRMQVAVGRGDDAIVHWRGGGVADGHAYAARLSEGAVSAPERIDISEGVVATAAAVGQDGLGWVAATTGTGRIEARSCDPFTGCSAVIELTRDAAFTQVGVDDGVRFAVTWLDAQGAGWLRTWSPDDQWTDPVSLPGSRSTAATGFLGDDVLVAADPPSMTGERALVATTLDWGGTMPADRVLSEPVRIGAMSMTIRGSRAAIAWAAYDSDLPTPGEIQVVQYF